MCCGSEDSYQINDMYCTYIFIYQHADKGYSNVQYDVCEVLLHAMLRYYDWCMDL